MPVSEAARRNIIQMFKAEGISWSGKLTDADFLSRLYDLESLPSHDVRYGNAKDDILTHTIVFRGDWTEDWVFDDKRFNLRQCSDQDFLNFLCETVHPLVRPNREEAAKIVEEFNRYLGDDGYQIVEMTTKFGNIRYEARGSVPQTIEALEQLRDFTEELKADHISKEIVRMRSFIDRDPEVAIGSAKDFIESVCKTIMKTKGKTLKGTEDLPKLVHLTLDELKLLSFSPTDKEGRETLVKMFGSLSTLVQSVAELRNYYGTGHGRDKGFVIDSRYAALAVNSAATIAMLLLQSYWQAARGQ